MKTVASWRRHHCKPVASIFLITLVMTALIGAAIGCSGGPIKVYSWTGLDKVRNDLGGSYILMNDLDSATMGYPQHACATANGGNGWDPIGSADEPFYGTFDGQGHTIKDFVINRPLAAYVGLFGAVVGAPGAGAGVIENLGVMNATVTGTTDEWCDGFGCLVGVSYGTVSNCHASGNVSGYEYVGGLVGWNYGAVTDSWAVGRVSGTYGIGGLVGFSEEGAIISNSYATGDVTGYEGIGGLVGENYGGSVTDSYSTANVSGYEGIGGLVGQNYGGSVTDSYSTANVTGYAYVGGLVGQSIDNAVVSNSHYNYDEALVNGQSVITVGALYGDDFEEWLGNDRSLDVNARLSQEDGYYSVNDISDFKELLAFGQDSSLKFSLKNDLDLSTEPDFYIPYLAGEFDGNGHNISNLNVNLDFASGIGMFGRLASGGKVTDTGASNVSITAYECVGGLVGDSDGTVSNCYSIGNVAGSSGVGGLVGTNRGLVSMSYSAGEVAGDWDAGGLVGINEDSWVEGYVVGSGSIVASYSAANVIGTSDYIGGLVGYNYCGNGSVEDSFWDTEASGQSTSQGGTGKTTAEMKDITTFTDTGTEGLDEPWDIIAVANPGTRNTDYIWNIVDDVTYPFLSWQP